MEKNLMTDAQRVLDELLKAQLIPFPLEAQKLDTIGRNEYIVRFHDSRLRSVDVSCADDQAFAVAFRAAVIGRVDRLSGPLKRLARTAKP